MTENELYEKDSKRWNEEMDRENELDHFYIAMELVKMVLLTWIALEVAL